MRLVRAIALLAALALPTQAQVPVTGAGLPKPAGGGGGFTPSCSQSGTFLAAATGVTLTADKTNYDTLICGLVSDGVWNFDVLYIWAAPNQATAQINLANPGTYNATLNGTVSFSAYHGFTGDASTFYIDSGFVPGTAPSPKFVQNSATIGVYVLSTHTNANQWDIGCSSGGCPVGTLFSPYQSGNLNCFLNSTTSVGGGGPANTQGSWNCTRIDATNVGIYRNSVETAVSGTSGATSSTPPSLNVIFFAFNPTFGLSNDQIAAGWIGAGVGDNTTSVGSCKINNRINTYMAAYSINVYTNVAC